MNGLIAQREEGSRPALLGGVRVRWATVVSRGRWGSRHHPMNTLRVRTGVGLWAGRPSVPAPAWLRPNLSSWQPAKCTARRGGATSVLTGPPPPPLGAVVQRRWRVAAPPLGGRCLHAARSPRPETGARAEGAEAALQRRFSIREYKLHDPPPRSNYTGWHAPLGPIEGLDFFVSFPRPARHHVAPPPPMRS
jgi:hypothetical protein